MIAAARISPERDDPAPLRAPDQVLRLTRMGSFHQTRLSFMRVLLRHLAHHRWQVERTLAWLNQSRRLSKDYERLPQSSEAMIYLSMTWLMLRRLTAT